MLANWLMKTVFGKVPTCCTCGAQTDNPPTRLEVAPSFIDALSRGMPECPVCPVCGSDQLAYRPIQRKRLRVYLAGNMVTDWREAVKEMAPEFEWVEPARGDDWFERQCRQMDACDVCFAFIDTEARHIGTVSELSAFRVMGKPCVLVIAPERRTDRAYNIAEKIVGSRWTTCDRMEGIRLLRQLETGLMAA